MGGKVLPRTVLPHVFHVVILCSAKQAVRMTRPEVGQRLLEPDGLPLGVLRRPAGVPCDARCLIQRLARLCIYSRCVRSMHIKTYRACWACARWLARLRRSNAVVWEATKASRACISSWARCSSVCNIRVHMQASMLCSTLPRACFRGCRLLCAQRFGDAQPPAWGPHGEGNGLGCTLFVGAKAMAWGIAHLGE